MKLVRFYVLFALFIMVGWNSVFAQSVTFSDLRLEHNVPDIVGREMLQFHYNMIVTGCSGHNVRVVMWVDIPQGVTHYYANGNKMISQSGNLYCSWEPSNYQNMWIGIYNDLLNPRPGKNTYYTRLGVWDETLGRYIGWSDFISFEMIGGGYHTNGTHPSYSNTNQSSSSSSIGNETTTKPCTFCNATGLVPSDRGEKIGLFFDTPPHYCEACCQTHRGDIHDRCPICKGNGRY